jgi:energy-coupling factor transporter ATP-binding protein EcfA2
VIRKFTIEHFKSLDDFQLPPGSARLGRFACFVGLNGAGKSTVLQAFDFVGQLVTGRMEEWLERREWEASDLRNRRDTARSISFSVEFDFPGIGSVIWSGEFNASLLRCNSESILVSGAPVLRRRVRNKEAVLFAAKGTPAETTEISFGAFVYQGSVLSILDTAEYHPALGAVKRYAQTLKSLELLNPHAMRRRAREGSDIGFGGERLAGYLHGVKGADRQELEALVAEFYPHFRKLGVKSFRAGWKELLVDEDWSGNIQTRARHLNDGLLRLIAILSQLRFQPDEGSGAGRCILFDEIENGINPGLMKKLIDKLLTSTDQIFVTTHSPMILNWLPDEVAQEAVIFLYRNSHGNTKAVRLFDLPTASKRLGVLGPGEVFVDVDLEELAIEAEQLAEAQI